MRMSKRILLPTMAVLVAGLASGCAATRPINTDPSGFENEAAVVSKERPAEDWDKWEKEGPRRIRKVIAGYAKSRVLDFLDMFEVGVSAGPWARVEAQYGLGFWGFAFTDATFLRLGRRSVVANEEATVATFIPFPVSLILFPAMLAEDKATGRMVILGGISFEEEFPIWPDPVFSDTPQSTERIRMAFFERDSETDRLKLTGDSFTVGAEAHLLIGARVRVMPLQILDFVAGLLGWDMLKDDVEG